MNLRFVRHQFGDDTAQAQRVLAKRRANQILACRGAIPLVKDQVEDFKYRREAHRAIGTVRHFEWHARRSERALCANDPLRDRRFRHEECSYDL